MSDQDPWPTRDDAVETVRFIAERARGVYGDLLDSVWLYGSRARGDHRPESDLDVLVVTTRAEANPHTLRGELRRNVTQNGMPPELWDRFFLQTAYAEQLTDWDTMFYRNVRADAVRVL